MNFIQNNQSFSTKNSQTFPSMPWNNFVMFHRPPNSSSGPKTPSNDEVEMQFPPFSTHVGLENITLKEGGDNSTKKKS